MDNLKSLQRNDTIKSEKNDTQKNGEVSKKNDSNLLTIYSFISSYVFKEDMNYDENDSRYVLLESQDLENENCAKKVSFSEYNEKIYGYYGGKSGSNEGHEEDEDEEEYEGEDSEEDEIEDEDDEHEDDEEAGIGLKVNTNEEDVDVEGNNIPGICKAHEHINKGATKKRNMKSMKEEKYIKKLWKKGKINKSLQTNNSDKENHNNNNNKIKKNINNFSKYFMLSMDNTNEQENIFKDEKQLSRQMSYYNDAYYYTSEMIYKNNRRHKEKFALYLRLISLCVNIVIGIYLITRFPHTYNEFDLNSQSGHSKEHENIKNIVRSHLEKNKYGKAYENKPDTHADLLNSESKVLKNIENKMKYFNILFRSSKRESQAENNGNSQHNSGSTHRAISNSNIDSNNSNNTNVSSNNKSDDTMGTNINKYHDVGENDSSTPIKDIDIIHLIDEEYIMNYIYLEMNKIYKYALYSFFGELLVISIIVFSLFILRIFIKDNNKFSVILTMYGILYKIFCYIFAHYVLVMGLYIVSIYYSIYVYRDIYENSFNFFCYHYVYNNIHIHLLMLFYAFQNIIFTINDTFNCIRMMFIILKHLIIIIYEKITCKNFITFYELKEDKSPLSLNCMNKFKNKCNMNNKCCRDKNCVEIDIDDTHESEYDKTEFPITTLHQKPYCKNLDIKTYEQSLLNMRNPIFK
ncbi:conserved Plasmodium protein, unknown function [Plasmodium malariae]|uniref:Uncharacterized protein n=1 Tax=Plasmodium malariae TaxID=5858 RepID=A0A1C3L241_PLAMA|nr:conserved Plasmodium protein, unknown function [Plasmodium malariae]